MAEKIGMITGAKIDKIGANIFGAGYEKPSFKGQLRRI
jgi:hypothetical protein